MCVHTRLNKYVCTRVASILLIVAHVLWGFVFISSFPEWLFVSFLLAEREREREREREMREILLNFNLGLDVRKPVFGVSEQQWHRPACAFALV